MPKENIKDRLDGNELDLSLSNLTVVPVKELAPLTKATHLDLSCNFLVTIPDAFCSLKHLVSLNLSKNQITSVPLKFGSLVKLQHLDLFNNKLEKLPVSFSQLKNLRWLDVKDNPLDPHLRKVAGDCLDDLQCKRCAQKIVAFMKEVQSEQDRQRQKKLEMEREKEAKRKDAEEKERQRQKAEKLALKERRKREYLEKQAELKRKEREEAETSEQETEKPSTNGVHDHIDVPKQKKSGCPSCLFVFVPLVMVILAAFIGFYFYCQQNERNQYCVDATQKIHELEKISRVYYEKWTTGRKGAA